MGQSAGERRRKTDSSVARVFRGDRDLEVFLQAYMGMPLQARVLLNFGGKGGS